MQQVEQYDSDDDQEDFFIESIGIQSVKAATKNIPTKLTLNGKPIDVKIDTGAKCIVMSFTTLKTIPEVEVQRSSTAVLRGFSGHTIRSLGVSTMTCGAQTQQMIEFHIVECDTDTLLGIEDCLKLNLINLGKDVSISSRQKLTSQHKLPQNIPTLL